MIIILSGSFDVIVDKESDGAVSRVYKANMTAPQRTVIRVDNNYYHFKFTGTGYYTIEYRGGLL